MPPKAKDKDNSREALRALKADLKAGTLGKLYVLHGEEAYLRAYYLREIEKALLPAGLEDFNLHTAQGRDCTAEWLEQAVDCLPMMSERTLVEVTDFDLFDGGEGQRSKILTLLGQLPDYCCLVFVYDLLPYKADGRSKLAALLKERGSVVNFARQEQGDLTDWIVRRFRAAGHTIDTEDARYLIFLCGDLMTNLISEIGKIAAYAKAQRVTREDIDAVAVPQMEAVVFRMTDAMARRDFDRAALVLADLLHDQQPPIMILAVMGKYLRQLYSARLFLDAGSDREAFMDMWAMRHSYQADRILDAAAKFSLPWCRHAVRRCAETDLAMKSGGGDPQELLIALLLELSAGRKVIV